MTLRLKLVLAAAALALLAGLLYSRAICVSAWLRYGISARVCPEGTPRQTAYAFAENLRRGSPGLVRVGAMAHFTTGRADLAQAASVEGVSGELTLVVAGKEQPLAPRDGWHSDGSARTATVVLPGLPDGDYLLRAKVRSRLGESSVDVPLAVHAPARVHVITDRPLYQPGNTVRFRAVALRARDLAPLEQRPGAWFVEDPSGEVMLEEKAPAGAWGVVAGSFPLDPSATSGTWKVRWASGDARDEATFRVEPFTLPRFKVEASSPRPFWRPGERPVLKGAVVYSSGAPVARARVEVDWSHSGAWPPPTAWLEPNRSAEGRSSGGPLVRGLERDLPRAATSDAQGRFVLELPPVPADLIGQATLFARLSAIDPAGDRVEGQASALLSQDAIRVSAVTELGDGVSEGFNNRLFLRATDAAGAPLPKAELLVQRAWDPSDPGVSATADEDAVASLQIDPGPPVNVVIPAMPYRPAPRAAPVARASLRDLLGGDEPPLADVRALDDLQPSLEPCTRHVSSSRELAEIGLRVDAAGEVAAAAKSVSAASACIAEALGSRRLAPGPERFYLITYALGLSDLPELKLEMEAVGELPREVAASLEHSASDARLCLPRLLTEPAGLARVLSWRARRDRRDVALSWIVDPVQPEHALLASAGCVEAHFRPLQLEYPARNDALGVARLRASPNGAASQAKPQATTMLGYEFLVSARAQGEVLGSTRLRLRPGVVPDVRLRATPIVVEPGSALAVEVLRGPRFTGALPEKLALRTESTTIEVPVSAQTRTATFPVPDDAQGWLEVGWSGARAIAYVRPRAQLSVAVAAEKEHYAPGQTAKLRVETRAGDKGVRAAVGLFGVDESLSQIAVLPGPDELSRLRPGASVAGKAFDMLDAQALALGRVRGANAAMATVLRVSALPSRAEIDSYVNARGAGVFDPVEELTDRFYPLLAELHERTRLWEQKAPEGERMHPSTMARLWKEALEACRSRGEKVVDAYGRPLRLSRLPGDLLSLVDPRNVVVNGTRLPEDVENWSAWVEKEEP